MPLVKFTEDCETKCGAEGLRLGHKQIFKRDQVVEMDEATARRWTSRNKAILIEAEVKEKQSAAPAPKKKDQEIKEV